jgi:hypothetical protein
MVVSLVLKELASSRVACLLGDWTEEPDYSSLAIGLLLGRWGESPVRPKSLSPKKKKPNNYRLQLAAIPLLDPAHVKEEKARFFSLPLPSSQDLNFFLVVVDCPSKTF